jgi:preprotein translocase subunit SecD
VLGVILKKRKMKIFRIRNNWNRVLLISVLTLCGQNNYAQDRELKTNVIIDSLRTVEAMKTTYIEFRLKPLKYEATKEDSIKLSEIENNLTDKEIRNRIVKAFDSAYSDNEINDLYNFVRTTAFTKLIHSSTTNRKISEQFIDITTELDKVKKNIKQQNEIIEKSKPKFEPISIDREDGFYEIVDYDSNKDFKDIKLVKTPSIYKTEILKIEKNTNRSGVSSIDITFSKKGAKQFHLLTKMNIGNPIAIVIDKHIVNIPIVNSEILRGEVSISGNFTNEEIDKMIEKLKIK